MTVYLLLILSIIFLMALDKNGEKLTNDKKRSNCILLFSFILIYLVCVLRDPTVGRDIPGYREAYEWTRKTSFNDFEYIYFEKGYLLLMKICIKLGLSFQGFFAVAYTIILYPIYLFIKRYSTDKLFSAIIYICYISFEFNLTGLRQAIAISIVLLSFIALLEAQKFSKVLYVLLVLIAASFHKSAYIALVFLPVVAIPSLSWYTASMIFGTIIGLLSRRYLFAYIKNLFGKESFSLDAGLHIGGNIVFMVAIVAFAVYVLYMQNKANSGVYAANTPEKTENFKIYNFMLKVFMFGIVLAMFFGEETSARSFMFFSQSIMVLIPNLCNAFDKSSKIILKSIFVLFFVIFFYFNTLNANNFDIVPYRFFWKA